MMMMIGTKTDVFVDISAAKLEQVVSITVQSDSEKISTTIDSVYRA